MAARTLVIGLDATEQSLLLEWAAAGLLPTFRRLLDTATWGITEAPAGVYAGAVWTSFNTGTDPSRHRRYFSLQTADGGYLETPFTTDHIASTPFWEVLSSAGARVAMVDVPHSQPAPSVNGVQILDWTCHDPETARPRVHPAGASSALPDSFWREPSDNCDRMAHSAAGYRTFFSQIERRLDSKVALSRHLADSADWEMLVTVFGEAHCAGHQWWHLHDRSHPDHDAALVAQTGDLLERTYIAIDRAVGELIEHSGDATRIVVVSTHGMAALSAASVVLDEILSRLEPLAYRRSAADRRSRSLFRDLKRGWYALPIGLRGAAPLLALKSSAQGSLHRTLLTRERRRRPFYALPYNPHAGAIRINLVGRQLHGQVQPSDYRRLCEELRDELLRLACPQTGNRIVDRVHLAAEIYDGPFAGELPDLLVEWNRDNAPTAIASPRLGTVAIPALAGRSGDHTPRGIFFATGPGIGAGRLDRATPIVDFAPTFCAWSGTPPAQSMTGRPIAALCVDSDQNKRWIRR